ncbi:membrane protein [Mycobacterium phage Jeeves]|uniref:Membrane protein n=1 Tax=Mycobacterium phage Jeeves TaxID=2652402 RepID=A0A5J6T2F2_9CAUD|nr:membrane protein [Mycobacterium phage Jeeves]QFG04546.1 membrane protein [Mycobacterium phage Jeeves]
MRIGIGPLLAIVFMVLKLTHYIDWSWWWVAAPVWIPASIAAFFYLLAGGLAVLYKKL